jgi:allantoin racemase
MKENIEMYGQGSRLVSMRPLGMGVHDFQADLAKTAERLLKEGRTAVEEDGAEVLILGCTAEYGFCEEMQKVLKVPVIDATLAPFKLVELLTETAERFDWYPRRKWGSQAPPPEEVKAWGLFKGDPPVGNVLHDEESQ